MVVWQLSPLNKPDFQAYSEPRIRVLQIKRSFEVVTILVGAKLIWG